jgi:hypothetical protein
VGETDGVPGEEVLLGGQDLEGLALLRLTVRGGKPTLETTRVDFLAAARALPLTSRPTLFVTDGGGTTFHASWGRDEAIAWTPTRPLPGEPLAVIGSGASARILLGSWPTPRTIQVVSGDLRDAEEPLEFFADFRTVAFDSLAQGDPPSSAFAGPVPGGLDGGVDAYVFGGQVLIAPSSPDAPPERASIATLPGLAIAGTVGPSAGWMGLAPAAGIPGGEFLFQFASIGPSPRVTDLVALGQPGPISLVRTADVLEPERDVGMLRPTFRGVAPDPTRAMTLLVGNEAVDADIVGPPGTAIRWIARPASNPRVPGENESHAATIGPGGVARLRLLEAAIPEDPDLHEAVISIWLVTPAGHAYRGTWVVQVYRQPPDLGMEDEVPLLDFAPTVTGRTAPGSTVTVNGVSAEVDPDGSFSVPVDVGVVPTELRIVATDLVGNRTERVVTRVWPLDYRQLPFVPIAVLLTIAAAVVLFVRRPASGPGTRRTPDDGSTFEEIGG